MSTISSNMGLVVWGSASDPYDHTELAANFNKIDSHDHTPGSGVIIGTAGINPGAITTSRIADQAVTRAKIAPGAVGSAQLDTGYVHPLGSVIAWWYPYDFLSAPAGWVIPRGQTLSAAQHDFGGGSITLPDLQNSFILGAATSNTGSGPTFSPAMGDSGGDNVRQFGHTHTVNGHTHTIAGHDHTVNSHAHQVSSHDHGSGSLDMDKSAARTQQIKTDNTGAQRADTIGAPGDQGHKHNVSGRVADASPMTDSRSPGTDTVGLTTNSSTATTNTGLSGLDIRPNFVGLLWIMKVRL